MHLLPSCLRLFNRRRHSRRRAHRRGGRLRPTAAVRRRLRRDHRLNGGRLRSLRRALLARSARNSRRRCHFISHSTTSKSTTSRGPSRNTRNKALETPRGRPVTAEQDHRPATLRPPAGLVISRYHLANARRKSAKRQPASHPKWLRDWPCCSSEWGKV